MNKVAITIFYHPRKKLQPNCLFASKGKKDEIITKEKVSTLFSVTKTVSQQCDFGLSGNSINGPKINFLNDTHSTLSLCSSCVFRESAWEGFLFSYSARPNALMPKKLFQQPVSSCHWNEQGVILEHRDVFIKHVVVPFHALSVWWSRAHIIKTADSWKSWGTK